jgi:hypothetical protein
MWRQARRGGNTGGWGRGGLGCARFQKAMAPRRSSSRQTLRARLRPVESSSRRGVYCAASASSGGRLGIESSPRYWRRRAIFHMPAASPVSPKDMLRRRGSERLQRVSGGGNGQPQSQCVKSRSRELALFRSRTLARLADGTLSGAAACLGDQGTDSSTAALAVLLESVRECGQRGW